MMITRYTFTLLTCVLLPQHGTAQIAPPFQDRPGPSANPVALSGTLAREAFVTSPDGRLVKANRTPNVWLQSEVLDKPETIDEILARRNLVNDDKTREMLRVLNPKSDFSKGVLQKGSKVDMFAVLPDSSSPSSATKYTFDGGNLSKFAFVSQAERSLRNSDAALQLPTKAFGRPQFASAHVQNTQDIRKAAETLQAKSEKLSKLDIAVAQYQVEFANRQAELVTASAGQGSVPREQVFAAQMSARALKSTAERVESGKPAAELRTLRVNVFRGTTTEHVSPLQVYVVPAGAIESRGLWTREDVESWLNHFSFANDASPVEQGIPTNFDPRICIGPKNAAREMAALIVANKLTTCRKPDVSASDSSTVLTFRSPADVAKP